MERYNDEIQLKHILIKLSEYRTVLFKKKFSIIIFSCLFFLIGFLYAKSARTEYNATITFVVEGDNSSPLGAVAGIASQFGFDLSSGPGESSTFSQRNIIELLKSRGVVVNSLMQKAKVDGKTDLLIEHYLEINELKDDWDEDLLKSFSLYNKNSLMYDSISGVIWKDIIENNLTVELQSINADIIGLSYSSLNEEFAKVFSENLIDQMGEMYISHQTAQANNTLDFLESRADSVFNELQEAELEFARVKDINQRIVKASGRLKELQLMRQVEVLNAMYLEIIKNLELSKITLLQKTPIINIIDSPILPLDRTNMSARLAGFLAGLIGAFLSLCYFIFSKLFRDALSTS
tara:strand:- start:506 stop:1552 length:1047 start_codon:yes stop_codon:yes gene_type:complete